MTLARALFALRCLIAFSLAFLAIGLDATDCSLDALGSANGTWTRSGSLAHLVCLAGFDLVGPGTALCHMDASGASWNVSRASDLSLCLAAPCADLEPTLSVSVNASARSASLGGMVVYACVSGYVLSASSPRNATCSAGRLWVPSGAPVCERRTCDDRSLVNGVTVGGAFFGDVANMTCNAGYELFGLATRRCEADGKLAGEALCAGIPCPTLTAPGNGSVDYQAGVIGSVSVFSCNAGYARVGPRARKCLATGLWNETESTSCEANPCAAPLVAPANGALSAATGSTGARVAVTCVDGYERVGPVEYLCNVSGLWESQPVGSVAADSACVPRICSLELRAPGNGTMRLSSAVHGLGSELVLNATARGYTDSLVFACNAGFELAGPASLVCNASGSWSAPTPRCERVTCPALGVLVDGTVAAHGARYSDEAVASCNFGFALVGASSLVCQANGTWSAPLPSCASVSPCLPAALAPPLHGQATLTSVLGRSAFNFSCNHGYALAGDALRTCVPATLTWSGSANQTCEPLPCIGNATAPVNGMLVPRNASAAPLVTGSRAEVRCNLGFVLAPNSSALVAAGTAVECLPTGLFSDPPVCLRASCAPALAAPANGSLVLTAEPEPGQVGSRALFACDWGFEPTGPTELVCAPTGQWTNLTAGMAPQCRPWLCTPLALAHGAVTLVGGGPAPASGAGGSAVGVTPGATSVLSCNTGYSLVGLSTRLCLLGGNWSGETNTSCVGLPCATNLTAPANGTVSQLAGVVGDVALYGCNVGFALVGRASRVCTVARSWSGLEPPLCAALPCALALAAPGNGTVSQTHGVTGDVAVFACSPGWSLVGNASRTCANGSWTGWASPRCEPQECPSAALRQPAVGSGTLRIHGNTTLATAEYTCAAGWELAYEGAPLVHCTTAGHWSLESQDCVPLQCRPPLVAPEHGAINASMTIVGDRVAFNCSVGWALEHGLSTTSSIALVCLADGSWSRSPPVCVARPCAPALAAPRNGSVSLANGTTGSVARFACEVGYELSGSATRECLPSGLWSGADDQACARESDCEPPGWTAPRNGTVIRSLGSGMTVVLSFGCNAGFILRGFATRTCDASVSHEWSGGTQLCEPLPCVTAFGAPANGTVTPASGAGVTGGSVVFACNLGFSLAASSGAPAERRCLAAGNWSSDEPPVCEPSGCASNLTLPLAADVLYERVSVAGEDERVRATIGCLPGFRLGGLGAASRVRTCVLGGHWDIVTAFTCTRVACAVRPAPVDGTISASGTELGATLVVRCRAGWSVVDGPAVQTCLANDSWSGQPARCEKNYLPVDQFVFVGGREHVQQPVVVSRGVHVPNYASLTLASGAEVLAPELSLDPVGALVIVIDEPTPDVPIAVERSIRLDGTLVLVLEPGANFSSPIVLFTFTTSHSGRFSNVTLVVRTALVPAARRATHPARAMGADTHVSGTFACVDSPRKQCTMTPLVLTSSPSPSAPNETLAIRLAAGLGGGLGLVLLLLVGGGLLRERARVERVRYARLDNDPFADLSDDLATEGPGLELHAMPTASNDTCPSSSFASASISIDESDAEPTEAPSNSTSGASSDRLRSTDSSSLRGGSASSTE